MLASVPEIAFGPSDGWLLRHVDRLRPDRGERRPTVHGADRLQRRAERPPVPLYGRAGVAGRSLEEVLLADESRDERRRRMVVDRVGVGQLLDPAVEHDGDPVAHGKRLVLVVRDEDERDPDLRLQQLQLDLHLLAELAVERAERLVQQQEARPVHQGARERDALLLPARHLPRLAVRQLAHLHHLERLADAAADLASIHLLLPQAVRDVLRDGHVREERVVLEHRVHVALVRRHALHRAARDADLALVGVFEPREHPKRGGLAASGRSQERQELAGMDLDVRARRRP